MNTAATDPQELQTPQLARRTTPLSVESMEYHRLALAWTKPRRWKPLLGLMLGAVIYLGLMMILLVSAFVVDGSALDAFAEEPMDMYDQADFGMTFILIALMLPAVLIGFRLVGMKPLGTLSSVTGRLRWAMVVRCLCPAGVALTVSAGLTLLFSPESSEGAQAVSFSVTWLLMLLLLVPLQSAAEEYVFRGALMQAIGAWLKHPAWAILLPIPLFAMAHDYDLPGQLATAVFAAGCGWLTWRTGGLEAAVVLHVVNNVVVSALGFTTLLDANQTEITWASAAASTASVLIYMVWVDRQEHRREQLQV